MCTAMVRRNMRHMLARTLDASRDLSFEVLIVPRGMTVEFTDGSILREHGAAVGMGILKDGFPLFFDGMNESGLAVAALNFPVYSKYFPPRVPFGSIASYELIAKVLLTCDSTAMARELLGSAVITDVPFSRELLPTSLHWIISDRVSSITLEQTEDGLKIYDNTVGVLSNSPPFPYHVARLSEVSGLSAKNPELPLFSESEYTSNGYGAYGLPGDFSSPSRFLRAAFFSRVGTRGEDEVADVFHLMESVSIPRGAVISRDGREHHTIYTSCMDTERGVYYFHTGDNRSVRGVRMDARAEILTEAVSIRAAQAASITYL